MKGFKNNLPVYLCYLLAFVLGMKQVREPDIWWQLLSGRWMLENGQVTHQDVFSYTMAGQPWINVKWLYEIIIALLERMAGPQGVMLLQSVINVLIVHLIFKSTQLLGKLIKQPVPEFFSVIAVILFLIVSEYRMAGRPEMISHLMSALFLFILLKDPELKWKNGLLLVILQCLWANMHEGYPIGLVLIGSFLIRSAIEYRNKKERDNLSSVLRAAMVLIAAILVLLLNPNGIQLWTQPFEIYRQVWENKYTTELFSFTNPLYWTLQAKLNSVLLLLVIAYWFVQFKTARDSKNKTIPSVLISYMILILLFGYLALTANRNIIFAQILLIPSVPYMLKFVVNKLKLDKWDRYAFLSKKSLWISFGIGVLFYIGIVSNSYYKYTDSKNRYGYHISLLHNPSGAAKFIKANGISGTAFSDYFSSSYLLWSMYPDFKSYIDLRDLDVFPTSFFDEYLQLNQQPEKFIELDKKYNFNYLVISTSQLAGLQIKLYWEKGYYLIYVDPVTAIFVKENDKNKALINNLSIQKLFSWPTAPADPAWCVFLTKLFNPLCQFTEEKENKAPARAALFYNQVQNFPVAISFLLPNPGLLSKDREACLTLANSYMEYAKTTKDPQLYQQRMDSASAYYNMAKEISGN